MHVGLKPAYVWSNARPTRDLGEFTCSLLLLLWMTLPYLLGIRLRNETAEAKISARVADASKREADEKLAEVRKLYTKANQRVSFPFLISD